MEIFKINTFFFFFAAKPGRDVCSHEAGHVPQTERDRLHPPQPRQSAGPCHSAVYLDIYSTCGVGSEAESMRLSKPRQLIKFMTFRIYVSFGKVESKV